MGLSWCRHASTLTAPSFCDTSDNTLRLSERWCETNCIQHTKNLALQAAGFSSSSSWTLSLCIKTAILSEMCCKIYAFASSAKITTSNEMFLTRPTFHKALCQAPQAAPVVCAELDPQVTSPLFCSDADEVYLYLLPQRDEFLAKLFIHAATCINSYHFFPLCCE